MLQSGGGGANTSAMLDWTDLRYFLAVARTGSTLAAGRSLKVAQATVSRRITMLEEALGTPLLVRSRPCRPTAPGAVSARRISG